MGSNIEVVPSLDSRSNIIPKPALHLLLTRVVLLEWELKIKVLNPLVQIQTSLIPGLWEVETHPKVEGSSASRGEPGHKSAECRKAFGNRNKALLMEEMVEQSCEDDIPTYISPLKKKLG